MRLSALLEGMPVRLDSGPDPEVADLGADSREIAPGWAFVALRGEKSDGAEFIPQALERGACAVFSEGTPNLPPGIASCRFEGEPRPIMAALARRLHGQPDAALALIGVTGTNGKTTTTMLIRQLLRGAGKGCGLIGTVMNAAGDREEEAVRTTPESPGFYRWLRRSVEAGDLASAVEVSSHALCLDRVAGARFRVGVFTNLTQDHLDYHPSMQAYFQAKMRLFDERLKTDGVAVVNTRDMQGIQVASAMRARSTRVISYGEAGSGADLVVLERIPHAQGQTLKLSAFGTAYQVQAPVAGAFQAENILCALGLAVGTGVPVDRAIAGVARLASVPGRLELAAVLANGATVYVDYAHTPDALQNVLRSVRPHVGAKDKLHVLFGCGGDRDPGKRPIMGRIAEELSDCVWVTDDNPRTEDPDAIRKQVLSGATGAAPATNAGPRREALQLALCALRPGDVLVVAGKGHEDYQVVLERDAAGLPLQDSRGRPVTKKIPFSDARVIREIIASM